VILEAFSRLKMSPAAAEFRTRWVVFRSPNIEGVVGPLLHPLTPALSYKTAFTGGGHMHNFNDPKTRWWFGAYPNKKADLEIRRFLDLPIRQDWLKQAREALFLSTRTMAEKLGINRGTYVRLEKSEVEGRISLNSLKKCADAMGCELVYAIRPKNQQPFSDAIWHTFSEAERSDRQRPPWLTHSPRYRRAKGWARAVRQRRRRRY
jgi:transcriptional regulator with XRE-family HTH domain